MGDTDRIRTKDINATRKIAIDFRGRGDLLCQKISLLLRRNSVVPLRLYEELYARRLNRAGYQSMRLYSLTSLSWQSVQPTGPLSISLWQPRH